MPLICTNEDAETFTLRLLAMTDLNVVRSFKAASENGNEGAASLCLEEMTRRNLTFALTFSPEELRAAACLARRRSRCGMAVASEAGIDRQSPQSALNRIATYWDAAADKAEAMLCNGTATVERPVPSTLGTVW